MTDVTEPTDAPDWRLLAPHRPLPPGDDAYVVRPVAGGDAIATWVTAGGSTVLVSGPTGVGKSTELAHAALALRPSRVAALIQVDRLSNIRRLTSGELLHLIAQRLVGLARRQLHLPISEALESATEGYTQDGDLPELRDTFEASGATAARVALSEVARVSRQGRVALLIDGLEKLLPGPGAREIFDALAQLPEAVDLVVVIPWHAAFAGGTEPILRAGERVHRIAALETDGPEGLKAAEFLGRVLARRLRGTSTLPESLAPLLGRAFKASGGIPRVFLQLLADAGTYARALRAAAWPVDDDLSQAIVDQKDSFRRALLPGDTTAINSVVGTDGRELDAERRVRLLAQGILLERIQDGRVALQTHPLVTDAVINPTR